eukprot:363061-Chlamydomonas_euryale.AAC.4
MSAEARHAEKARREAEMKAQNDKFKAKIAATGAASEMALTPAQEKARERAAEEKRRAKAAADKRLAEQNLAQAKAIASTKSANDSTLPADVERRRANLGLKGGDTTWKDVGNAPKAPPKAYMLTPGAHTPARDGPQRDWH